MYREYFHFYSIVLFIVYCILYLYALYSAAKTAGILGSHHLSCFLIVYYDQ